MKLEIELKQKKFKDAYYKLRVNIIYTSNWMERQYSRDLKKFGISTEQFNILQILRGQYPNPSTINFLVDRLLNKMSNASRLVEALKKKGLLERDVNQGDGRARDVLITKKGFALLKKLDKIEEKWIKNFYHLSENEIEKTNDLLDMLRK
jgi:DNA-binding MarR family transcriptional regulator